MAISAISARNAYADYTAAQGTRADPTQAANSRVPGEKPPPDAAAKNSEAKSSGDKNNDDKSSLAKKSELSPEERAQVSRLQARDREVRQHEAAHLAASGGLATSGASFTYQKGADGVNYAIGGEVSINTSAGRTPQETIQRAQTIKAAALAPADPSGADRAIAGAAAQMEAQARLALANEGQGEKPTDGATQAPLVGSDGKPIPELGEKKPSPPTEAPSFPLPTKADAGTSNKESQVAQAYGKPVADRAPQRVNVFA